MPHTQSPPLYIGLMSGTSLDGVDGALATFCDEGIQSLASSYVAFPEQLRSDLMTLQAGGDNEIHRESLAAQELAHLYAACVDQLLVLSAVDRSKVRAIGVHGQTIRHRPELGYTRQTNNPALLAELTGIDVIADFRSRDIAAGGQGAPLVPAFHQALCAHPDETRVIANIGGMANISILHQEADKGVSGFDTGPGNVLMDAWIMLHQGKPYDANGIWGAAGNVHEALLGRLLDDPFFALVPPKSTGRDLFSLAWLQSRLQDFPELSPVDIQATLVELTAVTLADAIRQYAIDAKSIFVCGGGAANACLMQRLSSTLAANGINARLASTTAVGVAPNQVEALAFAWLAQRFVDRLPGNLPAVTGAIGTRILGALYPA